MLDWTVSTEVVNIVKYYKGVCKNELVTLSPCGLYEYGWFVCINYKGFVWSDNNDDTRGLLKGHFKTLKCLDHDWNRMNFRKNALAY